MNRDQLETLIDAAVRAPSGHNTQPWHFAQEADEIVISPDFSRELPAVDGDRRELFISLGCAAENLCLQVSVLGYAAEVLLDGENIRIRLHATGIAADPLAAYIRQRQTNRSMYNGSTIPEGYLKTALSTLPDNGIQIHLFDRQSEAFELLAEAVMQGNAAQMCDPAFKAELLSWIRFNKKHAERTRDGVSYAALGAPNLPRWLSEPIVRLMLNAATQNKTDRKKIAASSHLALVTSPADNLADRVSTGRSLQRFLLSLTQQGIAHAYFNQPCEVPALRQQLQNGLFPNGGEQPQLLLRLGYAAPLPYAERRPLKEVLSSTIPS
ncbi:nitroreductase family protein [Eikenella sp. Marseille-P7795]|uniref:Acg family FMN-binding oxidoreductase n=1 Tax=Eikenella sp. Marseille-P7795 TaxID=2866577 RepID=UPI001CE3DD4E|nr:nitroreductase family protein [Eikenella sp. Marseille-P7795]